MLEVRCFFVSSGPFLVIFFLFTCLRSYEEKNSPFRFEKTKSSSSFFLWLEIVQWKNFGSLDYIPGADVVWKNFSFAGGVGCVGLLRLLEVRCFFVSSGPFLVIFFSIYLFEEL